LPRYSHEKSQKFGLAVLAPPISSMDSYKRYAFYVCFLKITFELTGTKNEVPIRKCSLAVSAPPLTHSKSVANTTNPCFGSVTDTANTDFDSNHTVPQCTHIILYRIMLYRIKLYCIMLYRIIILYLSYCTISYCTYHAVPYHTVPYHVPYHTVPIILYHIILYGIILYCIILYLSYCTGRIVRPPCAWGPSLRVSRAMHACRAMRANSNSPAGEAMHARAELCARGSNYARAS